MSQTQTSEDFVRRMLLKDHTIDWVVDASGWTRKAVEEVHAELERDQLLPGLAHSPIQPPVKVIDPPQPLRVVPATSTSVAAARGMARSVVAATRSDSATDLFTRASRIGDPAVKTAYNEAKTALAALAVAVTSYEQQAETHAEIADLEAKLAAAKARLRGEPSPGPRSMDHGPAAPVLEPEQAAAVKVDGRKNNKPPTNITVDYPVAEVRAWAKTNGLPTAGRFLRREVVDAWRAAMGRDA